MSSRSRVSILREGPIIKSRHRNRKAMVRAANVIIIRDFFRIMEVEKGVFPRVSIVCWMIFGMISWIQSTAIRVSMPDKIEEACLYR